MYLDLFVKFEVRLNRNKLETQAKTYINLLKLKSDLFVKILYLFSAPLFDLTTMVKGQQRKERIGSYKKKLGLERKNLVSILTI